MFDRRATVAFIVLCVSLLFSASAFQAGAKYLSVFLKKDPVPLRRHFSNIPNNLTSEWSNRGQDRLLSEEIVQSLGTDEYLNRTYVYNGEEGIPSIDVHVAYYTGVIDSVPHVPDRCFVAGGLTQSNSPQNYALPADRSLWREDHDFTNLATGDPYFLAESRDATRMNDPVRMPIGDYRIRVQQFADPEAPAFQVFGGYYFVANGRMAASPGEIKLLAFDKNEKYAYYCKIQFTMVAPDSYTMDDYLDAVGALNDCLLPELMTCLPDWAEVERLDR